MDKEKAAVIIPFYKEELSGYEITALEQCFKVLAGHKVIAIKPQKLVLPGQVTKHPFFETISFNNAYFAGIQGYNRLMLSAEFYGAFLQYEYILIYQLDAFVFKDELLFWCNKGFDYIGAPWINPHPFPDMVKTLKSKWQYFYHTRFNVQHEGLPSPKQYEYKVGNGGFSLRRTAIFHKLCTTLSDKIEAYNKIDNHLFNEDVFWSIEVNRKRRILKIPGYKTGLKFSFEFYPFRAFEINKQQLPFGCHAWDLQVEFWQPVFEKFGYII